MMTRRRKLALGVFLSIFGAPALSAAKGLEGEIKVSSGVRPMDLVVYVVNPPQSAAKPNPPRTAVIDQRNQTYLPHVSAVLKGTTVKFQNSDRVTHNVFSVSPAKAFDLGKIAPNQSGQVSFDKPGIIEVLCGFHSRMLAYVRVMDHPYFAVPDARGKFVIKDLPPGRYQLRIWHESLSGVSRKITLTPDQTAPIQLSFPR